MVLIGNGVFILYASLLVLALIVIALEVKKILVGIRDFRTDLARHEKLIEAQNTQSKTATVAVLQRLDRIFNDIPAASVSAAMARVSDTPAYEAPPPHYGEDDPNERPNHLLHPRRKWTAKSKKPQKKSA